MKNFLVSFSGGVFLAALLAGGSYYLTRSGSVLEKSGILGGADLKEAVSDVFKLIPKQKSPEELYQEALERSSNIKGLYMTADVASDPGIGAERIRNNLIRLATTTEINGLVIDVKEVCGPDYDEGRLRNLVLELKRLGVWTIARIVVFKDHSQIEVHPEWYLKRKSPIAVGNECWNKKHLRIKKGEPSTPRLEPSSSMGQASSGNNYSPSEVEGLPFWRDRRGGYWLDPAHPEAREYLARFSKKIIDLGFDELQFDYIRFPSDGDVDNAIYPAWQRDGKTPKYEVMKSFFEFLSRELRSYKPDIILSADLFGYAAIRAGDVGIGQRLDDVGNSFDYISFMVYPSHYYSGFYIPADPIRGLPALKYSQLQARANPGDIVRRSMLFARDFLDGKISTSSLTYLPTGPAASGTSTLEIIEAPKPRSRARLRPWLEDFFHENDKAAGRPWGKEKVRLQIEAAQNSDNHGWLLWNAANVYTEGALQKE